MSQAERIARIKQLERLEELEMQEKGEEKPTRRVWVSNLPSAPEMVTSDGEIKKRRPEDRLSKAACENKHTSTNASAKKTVYDMRNETRNTCGTAKNASIKQGAFAKAAQTKAAETGATQVPGQTKPGTPTGHGTGTGHSTGAGRSAGAGRPAGRPGRR